MTDIELTTLAAKAFGNAPDGFSPLTDDGDALRLAVKLGICLGPNFDGDRAIADGGKFSQHRAVEMFGGDKDAATRRAIVRCAAEIGKEMK